MEERKRPLASHIQPESRMYNAPTPAYRVIPNDPIPSGYVTHARDACVEADIRWDSQREPLEWGNGGEFGEEWSAMHHRLRNGMYKMIQWYRNHGMENPFTEDDCATAGTLGEDDTVDDDTDIVLVLVTHAAGCNALFGALTNQPVLMDFGLASLTMAVRKEAFEKPTSPPPTNGHTPSPQRRRRSSIDLGLSEQYDIAVTASTDHLRSGADPSQVSVFPSPKIVPRIPEYRRRQASGSSERLQLETSSSSSTTHFPEAGHGGSMSTALGSMRRISHSAPTSRPTSSSGRDFSPSISSYTSGGGGLWSKTPTTPATSVSSEPMLQDIPKELEQSMKLDQPAPTPPSSRSPFEPTHTPRNSSSSSVFGHGGGGSNALKTIFQGHVDDAPHMGDRLDTIYRPKDAPPPPPEVVRTYGSGLWGAGAGNGGVGGTKKMEAPPSARESVRELGPRRRWSLND